MTDPEPPPPVYVPGVGLLTADGRHVPDQVLEHLEDTIRRAFDVMHNLGDEGVDE